MNSQSNPTQRNPTMAHRQDDPDLEQTQRIFGQLKLNENQGRTISLNNQYPPPLPPKHHDPNDDSKFQSLRTQPEQTRTHQRQDPHYVNQNPKHKTLERTSNLYQPNQRQYKTQNETPTTHTPSYTNDPKQNNHLLNYNADLTTIQRAARSTTPNFERYRTNATGFDQSFSTTTSTTNEHNQSQIQHNCPINIQKSRLTYPTMQRTFSTQDPYPKLTPTQHQRTIPRQEQRSSPIIQHQILRRTSSQRPSPTRHQTSPTNTEHKTNQEYMTQQPKLYPLRRSPNFLDLRELNDKVVNEINSIMLSDHFVTSMDNNETTNRRYNASDSDSSQDTLATYRPQTTRRPTPTPRKTLTTQINPPSPYQDSRDTLQPNRSRSPLTQNQQAINQDNTSYTLIYDDENLLCHGKGWQDKFKNYPDKKFLSKIRQNPRDKINTTTIHTNNPFMELSANLQSKDLSEEQPKPKTTLNTTASSNQTDLDPLSSTFNEITNHPHSQPEFSPIFQHKQDKTAPSQPHNNDPKHINKSFELFHAIDNELRSHPPSLHNNSNTSSHSLPLPNTSTQHPNTSILQTDGNDTDLESKKSARLTPPPKYKHEESLFPNLLQIQTENPMEKQHPPKRVETSPNKSPTLNQTLDPPHMDIPDEFETSDQYTTKNNIQPTNTLPYTDNPHDLPDYTNPEHIKKIIKQNEQIIEELTTRTTEEEMQQALQHLTQSLNNLKHKLHNIPYRPNGETKDTSPSYFTTPSPTSSDELNRILRNEYANDFDNFTSDEEEEEAVDTNVATIHLNAFTSAELYEMAERTTPRCLEKFELTRELYDQVSLNVEQIYIQIQQKTNTEPMTQNTIQQLEQLKNHLQKLRLRQITLGKKLQKLSKIEEHNSKGIPMPIFGDQFKDNRISKNIPCFNPKNETTFDIIWNIIIARGQRQNLNEESYKEILEETLKGESLKYYTTNRQKPLKTIINILYNAYVTTNSQHQIRHLLDNFTAQPGDDFRKTLEKLKLLVAQFFEELPYKKAQQEEAIEIRKRIINNNLVDKSVLAAVYRKQKEYYLKGEHFDFINELILETDIQKEAGIPHTSSPGINTISLNYTTTTNGQQQSNQNPQQVQIGKTSQNHISARPRPPSEEKLKRIFRHSPKAQRPQSSTPHSSPHRNNSLSPNRASTPQHISSNTQRALEGRQRESRHAEYERRRFNNTSQSPTNRNNQTYQNENHPPRQQSTESTTPKYSQFTNNQFPQIHKPRSFSAQPNQQYRSQSYQPRRNFNNQQNNPNFTPIRYPNNTNRTFENNNNRTFNQQRTQYNNNGSNRNPSPNQNQYRQNQFQSSSPQYRNPQRSYNPRPQYENNRQFNNKPYYENNRQSNYKPYNNDNRSYYPQQRRILRHLMTYSNGDDRDGKINQEFSVSEVCNKQICRNQPDHPYKQCPRNKGFSNRH